MPKLTASDLHLQYNPVYAGEGSYGEGIEVVVFDLLDDPAERKKVDAMPEGPEKNAARYIANADKPFFV